MVDVDTSALVDNESDVIVDAFSEVDVANVALKGSVNETEGMVLSVLVDIFMFEVDIMSSVVEELFVGSLVNTLPISVTTSNVVS